MTSVTAFGANGRRTSAAARFSAVIDATAASSAPGGARPSRCACRTMPVPSGFVRKSTSPGFAPAFGQSASGRTMPTTASPYFGSSSRIVWPPARIAPAARTRSSAPASTSPSTSVGSSSGKAATESASSGAPPIAKTSFSAFDGRDRAERPRVVDERREEVDGEDDRPLVVEAVHRRVVGGVEPDEQVVALRRDEAGEQTLEPRRRVLGRTAARPGERRQRDRLHEVKCRSEGVPQAESN